MGLLSFLILVVEKVLEGKPQFIILIWKLIEHAFYPRETIPAGYRRSSHTQGDLPNQWTRICTPSLKQTCHEAYYEGELLNGVDLKIKEMRGLDADPELIDFLRESQELVFWVSSSIVLYNTHKKTYQHLLNVEGEVTILKTRLDKTNNREYIMWVERQSKEKEQEQFILKKYGKAVNNAFKESRLKKRVGVGAEKQRSSLSQEDSLLKTLFSGFG